MGDSLGIRNGMENGINRARYLHKNQSDKSVGAALDGPQATYKKNDEIKVKQGETVGLLKVKKPKDPLTTFSSGTIFTVVAEKSNGDRVVIKKGDTSKTEYTIRNETLDEKIEKLPTASVVKAAAPPPPPAAVGGTLQAPDTNPASPLAPGALATEVPPTNVPEGQAAVSQGKDNKVVIPNDPRTNVLTDTAIESQKANWQKLLDVIKPGSGLEVKAENGEIYVVKPNRNFWEPEKIVLNDKDGLSKKDDMRLLGLEFNNSQLQKLIANGMNTEALKDADANMDIDTAGMEKFFSNVKKFGDLVGKSEIDAAKLYNEPEVTFGNISQAEINDIQAKASAMQSAYNGATAVTDPKAKLQNAIRSTYAAGAAAVDDSAIGKWADIGVSMADYYKSEKSVTDPYTDASFWKRFAYSGRLVRDFGESPNALDAFGIPKDKIPENIQGSTSSEIITSYIKKEAVAATVPPSPPTGESLTPEAAFDKAVALKKEIDGMIPSMQTAYNNMATKGAESVVEFSAIQQSIQQKQEDLKNYWIKAKDCADPNKKNEARLNVLAPEDIVAIIRDPNAPKEAKIVAHIKNVEFKIKVGGLSDEDKDAITSDVSSATNDQEKSALYQIISKEISVLWSTLVRQQNRTPRMQTEYNKLLSLIPDNYEFKIKDQDGTTVKKKWSELKDSLTLKGAPADTEGENNTLKIAKVTLDGQAVTLTNGQQLYVKNGTKVKGYDKTNPPTAASDYYKNDISISGDIKFQTEAHAIAVDKNHILILVNGKTYRVETINLTAVKPAAAPKSKKK